MGKCKICGNGAFPGYDYCMNCNPNKDRKERDVGRQQKNKDGKHKDGPPKIPDYCFFDTFYEDDKKEIIKEEVFRDSAEKVAETLQRSNMKRGQLRRFLRCVKEIEFELKRSSDENFFNNNSWRLDELSDFVNYQANRESKPIKIPFKILYEKHLPIIKSNEKEFLAFVKYLAGILAYLTELESRNN